MYCSTVEWRVGGRGLAYSVIRFSIAFICVALVALENVKRDFDERI